METKQFCQGVNANNEWSRQLLLNGNVYIWLKYKSYTLGEMLKMQICRLLNKVFHQNVKIILESDIFVHQTKK